MRRKRLRILIHIPKNMFPRFDRIWKYNWPSEIRIPERKRVKILLRIPGSIDRHFPILPPRLTFLRQASSHLVNLLRGRRRGRGGGGKGRREGWLVEAQLKFSRRNNAETRKRRKKFLPAHFDPRTEEEAVIALKWTWVTQGPPPPRRGIINSQQRAR